MSERKRPPTESHGKQLLKFIDSHEARNAFTVKNLETLESMRAIVIIGVGKHDFLATLKKLIDSNPAVGMDFEIADHPLDLKHLKEESEIMQRSGKIPIFKSRSSILRQAKNDPERNDFLDHALVIRMMPPSDSARRFESPDAHLLWNRLDTGTLEEHAEALFEALSVFVD